VHERFKRQTTDGRTTTYSEHEHEFTFAKKSDSIFFPFCASRQKNLLRACTNAAKCSTFSDKFQKFMGRGIPCLNALGPINYVQRRSELIEMIKDDVNSVCTWELPYLWVTLYHVTTKTHLAWKSSIPSTADACWTARLAFWRSAEAVKHRTIFNLDSTSRSSKHCSKRLSVVTASC